MKNEEQSKCSDIKMQSKTVSPLNSSRIVLNCSTNFSSLRIEDPKRSQEDGKCTIRALTQAIPQLSRMFTIHNKIGEGTFSKVFLAKSTRDISKEIALKCIIPTLKPSRVVSELRFLRDLGGDSNIPPILTCLHGSGYSVFVMPYFRHDLFIEYVKDLSAFEIQDYMRNLLIALQKIHSHGVIHRDIKPTNFLYNRRERKYLLVDFGLSQYECDLQREGKQIMAKAMTSGTKRVLIDTTKATTNSVIADQISKQLLIRKRALNESERTTKFPKRKKSDEEPKPSIFHTPLTPNGKINKTNEYLFKTPTKCPLNENLKTPVKATSMQIIPETPPRTIKAKNGDIDSKSKVIDFADKTPRSRLKQTHKSLRASTEQQCGCFAKPQCCKRCLERGELQAPRAGTPGFRAPEVLLKYLHQTTAIDIWSAGVIYASLLSTRYPFFRNLDDLTSLAEIVSIFGSEKVMKTASQLGKILIMSMKNKPPCCLKTLCEKLRANDNFKIDDSAYDLLGKLLDPNPYTRITAKEALQHPFFSIES